MLQHCIVVRIRIESLIKFFNGEIHLIHREVLLFYASVACPSVRPSACPFLCIEVGLASVNKLIIFNNICMGLAPQRNWENIERLTNN